MDKFTAVVRIFCAGFGMSICLLRNGSNGCHFPVEWHSPKHGIDHNFVPGNKMITTIVHYYYILFVRFGGKVNVLQMNYYEVMTNFITIVTLITPNDQLDKNFWRNNDIEYHKLVLWYNFNITSITHSNYLMIYCIFSFEIYWIICDYKTQHWSRLPSQSPGHGLQPLPGCCKASPATDALWVV